FQAEDGIRDKLVTGVQTCALPILLGLLVVRAAAGLLAPGEPIPVDAFQVLVLLPSIGAFLGILTALFGTPASAPAARPAFSRRRSEERRVGKECRSRRGAGRVNNS